MDLQINFECVGATIGRPRAFNERPYGVAVRICPQFWCCVETWPVTPLRSVIRTLYAW